MSLAIVVWDLIPLTHAPSHSNADPHALSHCPYTRTPLISLVSMFPLARPRYQYTRQAPQVYACIYTLHVTHALHASTQAVLTRRWSFGAERTSRCPCGCGCVAVPWSSSRAPVSRIFLVSECTHAWGTVGDVGCRMRLWLDYDLLM